MHKPRIVITHAVRTPIGKFLGGLSNATSVDLGVAAVRGLLKRAELAPGTVSSLVFGNGRQAGGGPNPARQILVRSGIDEAAPAYTVNMACASGLKSIVLAAQEIENGEADIVVAGGTESMSRLPYLLPRARQGHRIGHDQIIDAMYQDGFQCPLAEELMGATAENLAERDGISRARQDSYAALSQRRCELARKEGFFADELVGVDTVDAKGRPCSITVDEHPRDSVTAESLAKLPAVFRANGTVHPGNSSGITDGAAAVLLMTETRARELGYPILGRIEGHAAAGVDPRYMGIGPVPATARLGAALGRQVRDWDLIELNEAFAAQVLACLDAWSMDAERVNVHGGAISLGHPIGATGARIVVTLLHAMKRRGARHGLATLCVSGGMGYSVSFARDD